MKNMGYIGKDETFWHEFQELAGTLIPKEKFRFFDYDNLTAPDKLFEDLVQNRVHVIYLDYAYLNPEELRAFVYALRLSPLTRRMIVVGLFAEESAKSELQLALLAGVMTNYPKGVDVEDVLLNSYYLINMKNTCLKKYATFESAPIRIKGLHKGRVDTLFEDHILLHCDIDFTKGQPVELEMPCLGRSGVQSFMVGKKTRLSQDAFAYGLEFKGNYKALLKERGFTSNREVKILVVDQGKNFFPGHIEKPNTRQFKLQIYNSLEEREESFLDYKPDIVILQLAPIDLSSSEDEANELNRLIGLMRNDRLYQPLLLVFGTSSSSEAFRKAYQYEKIMAVPNSFHGVLLPSIIDIYQKKTALEVNRKKKIFYSFPHFESYSFSTIHLSLTVSSLSENSVKFYCNQEIPFFTQLVIELPFCVPIMVIPSPEPLPGHPLLGRQYMGVVHGLNYKEKMLLRQLVNWCIFNPIKASDEKERLREFEPIAKIQKKMTEPQSIEVIQVKTGHVDSEVENEEDSVYLRTGNYKY